MRLFLALGSLALALGLSLQTQASETCPSSTSNRTVPCPSYVAECKEVALAKLARKAAIEGGQLDINTVRVTGLDDRWYNPSKYVWFSANILLEDGKILEESTLTQKAFFSGRKCF